jgi:hypothetical protein
MAQPNNHTPTDNQNEEIIDSFMASRLNGFWPVWEKLRAG